MLTNCQARRRHRPRDQAAGQGQMSLRYADPRMAFESFGQPPLLVSDRRKGRNACLVSVPLSPLPPRLALHSASQRAVGSASRSGSPLVSVAARAVDSASRRDLDAPLASRRAGTHQARSRAEWPKWRHVHRWGWTESGAGMGMHEAFCVDRCSHSWSRTWRRCRQATEQRV